MKKQTILITGASSGLGLDAAHGFRDAGWRVFASCRKQVDCDRLKAMGFDSPLIDHADAASVEAGFAEVIAATGGTLDVLYNNGAFMSPGAVEDLPRAGLEAIFQTNLFGVHQLTTLAVPIMRKQGHGRIINCSSVLGLIGMKFRGAYVATKFAMEGLTDVMRIELADTGIKMILIEPGPVTSKIRENAIPHFEMWIDWENSAQHEIYAVLRPRLYEDHGKDTFELPASAVTKKLLHAATSKRPKPRYYVTTPTYLMGFLKRILSTRALDAICKRV